MKYDGDGRATARFFSGKGCRRRLRFTRPCGAWPCGFSVMWPPCRVRAVPCLHRSRASAGGMQGKMNRCGHPVP
ncbi:DUF1472 domain-containing protein, partial [Escherichia coli]|nr:DUF1472 domain-containing protein [Escherichia coli]